MFHGACGLGSPVTTRRLVGRKALSPGRKDMIFPNRGSHAETIKIPVPLTVEARDAEDDASLGKILLQFQHGATRPPIGAPFR